MSERRITQVVGLALGALFTSDRGNEYMMIDATIVRAHQHSAGARKNGPQAIGRSRGGLTTKVHALVDALGNPVELMLTPDQAHDLTCAQPLLENADPDALIGDKAYDADPFVSILTERAITPVNPAQSQSQDPVAVRFRALLRTQPRRALLQSAQALPGRRHPLRQTRQNFSGRRAVGRRYDLAQLNTGASGKPLFVHSMRIVAWINAAAARDSVEWCLVALMRRASS
jgi:transposase